MSDVLKRFLFDDVPARGSLIRLQQSWQTIQARHAYPEPLQSLLGELLAACVLLASNLKFQGSLMFQMHGTGPLTLLVVECAHDFSVRALATWEGSPANLSAKTLPELLGEGKFVVTLDQLGAKRPYQSIVPLEGNTVSELLEKHMRLSEQLDTQFYLAATPTCAAGLLLQRLPEGQGDPEEWGTICQLAATVSVVELLNIPPLDLLTRLFHQYTVRILKEVLIEFKCRCSNDKISRLLRMMGHEELTRLLAEQGVVEINCEFCHAGYSFDQVDVEALFAGIPLTGPLNQSLH